MNKSTISPLRRALANLESERNTIDAAIVSLRGLINQIGTIQGRRTGRRGRPTIKTAPNGTVRKPKWSAAARKAAGARMKKRWDERRKVKAKST